MKIIILQENLAQGLTTVAKFVTSKTQLPVLNNILFSAKNGKLRLSATNLETGINFWLPAKIEKEGEITLPAKITTEFVSSLPSDKTILKLDQGKLEISCRNYKASFNTIPATEFPPIPSLEKKPKIVKKIDFPKDTFIKAINEVAFTAAYDESRPVLTGVRINFVGKKVHLVATDGYRLSLKAIKIDRKIEMPMIIIPARTLLEIAQICSQEEKEKIEINLLKEENQVIFSLGNIEVISRLIEGEFPDFEKIIPQESLSKVTIDRESFQQAIRTAALFARDSANIVRLEVKKTKLKIMTNAPEVGENEIELEVKKEGEDSQIAFNYRFLQEYLGITEEKEIVLEISGPLKPGVFKLVTDSSFLHIVMPVRIQE